MSPLTLSVILRPLSHLLILIINGCVCEENREDEYGICYVKWVEDCKVVYSEDHAYSVFNKLKETNKYRLMMVENLGVKLAEFEPKPPLRPQNHTQVSSYPFGGIAHDPRLWNDSNL